MIQIVICNYRRVIINWINKLNLNTIQQMLIPVLLLHMHFSSYSQKLDLIVLARGDSVACKIDSLTESQIFFQMKAINNKWTQTKHDLDEVKMYKYDCIDSSEYTFKKVTTILAGEASNFDNYTEKPYSQKYELWVKTSGNTIDRKRNYGFSNDTILMTFSNSSLIIPSKEYHYYWDYVTGLKIRNKRKNQIGQIVGATVGLTASLLMWSAIKNSENESIVGIYFVFFGIPITLGLGTLAGHLATSRKKEIQLYGLSSKEKNKMLKDSMLKKKKQ